MRSWWIGLLLAVSFGCAAAAQGYPSRPITLIVPYPAGGGVDAMARIVGEKLSAALGQQVIVENRAGGGGNIGTRTVARAAPDGYTLLLGHTATISINPSLYANAGYDPRKDFSGVGLIASMPVVLIAHPTFPAKSVAEFIALARRDPGKINIGTSAIGTGGYLSAELFKAMAGVDVQIVPYKGTAPLMNDVVGGHVPVSFGVLAPAISNIESGNLRALAVTSLRRFSLLPDVPTVDESGVPGFEAVLRYGLVAPRGTPPAVIGRLNAELRALVATDAVKQRIAAEGGDPLTSSPAEYDGDIEREAGKWAGVVSRLGLKIE
ncbi:MAG: LacI family transcriptional regulator [Proteobacteria bacterium]|nr:MAG: LacI family transcriptional regulator [Pseudomonadota bacterium]